jgi:hypothetical protein
MAPPNSCKPSIWSSFWPIMVSRTAAGCAPPSQLTRWKSGIEHHHPGRHIGQHGFQVGLGVLQRGAVALDSVRASNNWRVMVLNDWVSVPSSSEVA